MTDVFFDTNVAYRAMLPLPVGATQQEDEQETLAKQLWKMVEDKSITGFISMLGLTTLCSLLESYYRDSKWRRLYANRQLAESRARSDANAAIQKCMDTLKVCDNQASDLVRVSNLMRDNAACNDFEDNVQLVSAYEEGVRILVTFN